MDRPRLRRASSSFRGGGEAEPLPSAQRPNPNPDPNPDADPNPNPNASDDPDAGPSPKRAARAWRTARCRLSRAVRDALRLVLLPFVVLRAWLASVVGACVLPGQRWVVAKVRQVDAGTRRRVLGEGVEGYLDMVSLPRRRAARAALEEPPLRGRPVLLPRWPCDGFLEACVFEKRAEPRVGAAAEAGPTAVLLSGSGQVLEYESWNVGLLLQNGCRRVVTLNYSGVGGSGGACQGFTDDDKVRARADTWRPGAHAAANVGAWGLDALSGGRGSDGAEATPESMLCDALCAVRLVAALDEGVALDRVALACRPAPSEEEAAGGIYSQILERARRAQGRAAERRATSDVLLFGHSIGGAVALAAAELISSRQRDTAALRHVRLRVVADRTFNSLSGLAGHFCGDYLGYLAFLGLRAGCRV
eukprot:CAMPEP_0118852456 /NCGR_PEP_ID=MMETSP1163-20130328/1453_1 /TAXON_ID=124430 /ORGANISM="Phaeomonas parva, Strain CCMP2877" /LENGTH=418 /DNA_ID=CAMNT_0006784889 /DNA_START=91 /DNA_END=1344 /DNA_ORIENTATION=-